MVEMNTCLLKGFSIYVGHLEFKKSFFGAPKKGEFMVTNHVHHQKSYHDSLAHIIVLALQDSTTYLDACTGFGTN